MDIMFDTVVVGKKVFTGVKILNASLDEILSFMADSRIETMQSITVEQKEKGGHRKRKRRVLKMTIDTADKTYTGCDKCVHANDDEVVCRARLCIHAINHLKECYKPVRPTGHWIDRESAVRYSFWERYQCSECGGLNDNTKFCPHCGAKMEVSE